MLFAYLSGILSVLTPCTIVLLPIFLYRFGINNDDSKVLFKDLAWAILGFIVGVAMVAVTLNFLSASDYAGVIRSVIGMVLIILGVLHLVGRYRVSIAQNKLHPLFWGLILPWSVSLSPCVMPIFSSFLSVSLVSGEVWLKIVSFALGLLSPAILIAVIGSKATNLLKKSAGIMQKIEKYSGLLLIISGVYLNFQMMKIRFVDLTVVGVFFGAMFLFLVFGLWKSKRLFSFGGISFLISIFLLFTLVLTNCRHNMYETAGGVGTNRNTAVADLETEMQCSADKGLDCPVCKRCAVLFSFAALSGAGGYLLAERPLKLKIKTAE
jgi:cytochrome c biogenesis protein CcdA